MMSDINSADTSNTTAATRQQLVADLNLVLSDIEALIKATARQRSAEIVQARAKAEAAVAAVKVRIGDAETALTDHGRRTLAAAEDDLRQRPLHTMGIAAGAGLLIGLLLGRR